MKTFTAQVDEWVRESEARMLAVVKESVKRIRDRMQKTVAKGGRMPVDTGFLRSTLQAGINMPRPGPTENPGGVHTYNEADTTLVIEGVEFGDAIYMTYSANYARYVEYGARGKPGQGFVRLATQRWKQTVSQVAIEARNRSAR
jgi:HK97 gp10 family phage protein